MKVLLVEDSATLRYTMCSYIENAGHQSLVADSGEQALQLIEANAVDLVIMDVEMPGLDGFETTRLIREFFGERWVPIVFISGIGDESSYQRGIEAGGDDYMIKPVSPVILQAKLRAFERIVEMQDQLHQLNEELQALSQRDGLTELFNRRAFEEKADRQWQISTRAQEAVAVLMLDVDYFKEFNDCYGHQAGDDCLRDVARRLEGRLHRPADILARYGGEEFVVMLPNTHLQGAQSVADSLRRTVSQMATPHASSSVSDRVTVSVGGAVADHTSGLAVEELIRAADNALYKAKARGRNRVALQQLSPHKTLLVVDPRRNCLERVTEALREHYNIITATNGDEGLEIAGNCDPDLVLLGENLGTRETEGVCRTLKDTQQTTGIPVLQLENASGTGEELLREVERRLK